MDRLRSGLVGRRKVAMANGLRQPRTAQRAAGRLHSGSDPLEIALRFASRLNISLPHVF